jgi:GntR family transcriptional regulator
MSEVNPEPSGAVPLHSIDRTSGVPLHDQVAASIRRAIADGEAKPGEKLPQARDLAYVLGVNTNTVLRAIHILREEGLLDAGRGKSTTVAGTPERGALVARVNELVALGAAYGYGREELAALVAGAP